MMDEEKKTIFSVVMPTYNRATLLGRAIDSVLAQHLGNLELIVVDDGSMDNTHRVLSRYQDERLRCIHFEQNRGIGAARQAGVSCAVGKWVAFLDADDLWYPEKLSCDLLVLERHPEIDLIFDNYRNINYEDNEDRTGFDQAKAAFAHLETTEIEHGVFRIDSGLADSLLVSNLIGTASIITIRRDVFKTIGNFNPDLSGPEDFELLWRAALADICFAYQIRVLVERHKDSVSVTSQARSFIPQLLKAYDLCESNIKQYGRLDLLSPINKSRGRAWQSLIHAYALEGRRWDAVVAFRNSLRFGFSRQSLTYLLAALAGPRVIDLAKSIGKVFG